ncbi:MAG: glycosyltransferase family 9 protein [Gammaproteobacteria bacterium]
MKMKILAVRVGRVGDTVMMTPALTALLQYYPDAEITLLLSPAGKALLKDFHPNIKHIWTWQRSGILRPIKDKKNILKNLASTHFDKIICFDTSPRIGSLFTGLDTDLQQFRWPKTLIHCARAYLEFVAEISDKPAIDTYNYLPVREDASKQLAAELSEHGITSDDKILMIHPTFSGYSPYGIRKREAKLRKLWSPENYGRLIDKIAGSTDQKIRTVIMLLPDEFPFGRKILDNSNSDILLLKSESTFERYKAMIQRANVILTPDSGPMHVASALGTKIVAFFSMKDPGDCGPYMAPDKFIILRSEDMPQPEKGINAIDVKTVYDAVMRLFAR